MNLAFKLSGPDAIVYRKPWGVIVFATFMTAMCLTAGAAFSSILFKDPKSAVAIPSAIGGAIFAICGLLILQDMLRKLPTWFRNGGVPMVKASKSGVTIATTYSAKPQTYAWNGISEIVLAKSLETVESDETNWTHSQFIVVLTTDAQPKTIWAQVNAQIAKTGEGKAYLSTDFPPSQAVEIERAIRRLAPASVLVRRCKQVTFNRKASADTYEAA